MDWSFMHSRSHGMEATGGPPNICNLIKCLWWAGLKKHTRRNFKVVHPSISQDEQPELCDHKISNQKFTGKLQYRKSRLQATQAHANWVKRSIPIYHTWTFPFVLCLSFPPIITSKTTQSFENKQVRFKTFTKGLQEVTRRPSWI